MTIKTGHRSNTAGGFTLVEAMLAVVVLGIAATGVLLPFTSGASVRAEGAYRTTGARLATDLIEKIVKEAADKPLADIKSNYNYSEPKGTVKDAADAFFTDSNYANFSRSVICSVVRVPGESSTGEYKFILVTVQVNYNFKMVATVSRLISK